MNIHAPVMAGEVIEYLRLKQGRTIVDCTVGCGGHALKILESITPGGLLIGIDQDEEALRIADKHLAFHKDSSRLIHANYRNLDSILKKLNIDKIDGLLFDLGVASIHFDIRSRGFSIKQNGPLDMRMDRNSSLTARKIVNTFSRDKLEKIFWEYGEERRSRQIIHFILEARKKKPIETTFELSELVCKGSGRRSMYPQRIHPATRVFMALRIAVNDELEALKEGLISAIAHLKEGGRIAVISFHSLEDRIVKNTFKEYKEEKKLEVITKSPLRPSVSEVRDNPRARSAKLRIAERI